MSLPPDPDPLTTEYIRGYGDGWDDGVHVVEEERRSPLLGFVIVALAGLIVGSLITAAVVSATSRPVSAPPVPAQERTGAPPNAPAPSSERLSAVGGDTRSPAGGAPTLSSAESLARTSQSVTGNATWYRDPSKPIDGLYGAVPGWHYGDQPYALRVTASSRSVVVLIGDCLCGGIAGRVVDLSASAFSRLAPLSAGVVKVVIERVAVGPESPPPTDLGPVP